MNRTVKILRGAKKGAAAVEFALILPLFLTILFCTLDYGWMFFQQLAITSASREGARAAALAGEDATNTQISNLATSAVDTFLNANGISDAQTTTVVTAANGSTPATVSVNVTLTFRPLVGVFFLPGDTQPYPESLSSTAVMRREF